jgi:hypothetical protein
MGFSPQAYALAATAAFASCITPADAAAAPGGAQTFSIPVHARGSARDAFREAFRSLHGFGDLRLRSAFGDKANRFVEGSFTATLHGTPVSGVLLAGAEGRAVALYDTPDRAAHTIPAALAQLFATGGGSGGGPSRPLRRVSFGTGSIALPDSWSVLNSYQGCVEAASQQDHAYLALGCSQAALAPPLLPGTDPRQVLVITSYDPVAALQRFVMSPPPVGAGASGMRVVEVKPVQATANGRAAYVLFDYTLQGSAYRGLALVNLAAVDTRTFMLYKSMFMTPAATFPELAPVLWKSWQSWGVNGDVLTNRLFAAAQSMRETGDIITGAYWSRQHANAQVSAGWEQAMLGTAQLEDLRDGQRYNGSYWDASTLVQRDPTRYRIVPIGELQL